MSNKFITEKIGANSSFNLDKLDKLSVEPPQENMRKNAEMESNNEFRTPMPMSTRFKDGQNA